MTESSREALEAWLYQVRRRNGRALPRAYVEGARAAWAAAEQHFVRPLVVPCSRCNTPHSTPSGRKPRYDQPTYCDDCRVVVKRDTTRRGIQALRERRRAAIHA